MKDKKTQYKSEAMAKTTYNKQRQPSVSLSGIQHLKQQIQKKRQQRRSPRKR